MDKSRRLSLRQTFTVDAVEYGRSVGHKVRDFVDRCAHKLAPLLKFVFPNFIAVHYFYIVLMTISTSILIYPVRNMSYVDALFFSAAATTQGGLNTINVNDLVLYQQIVLYIVCNLCTPIFIHSTLAFIRLYWFERYFDGIRVKSKRDHKMRRANTIVQRNLTARTLSPQQRRNENGRRSFRLSKRATTLDDFRDKLFSGKLLSRDPQPALSGVVPLENISKRRKQSDITPADMTKSFKMLQDRQNSKPSFGSELEPTLVIKSPREHEQISNKLMEQKPKHTAITFAEPFQKTEKSKSDLQVASYHSPKHAAAKKCKLTKQRRLFPVSKLRRNSKYGVPKNYAPYRIKPERPAIHTTRRLLKKQPRLAASIMSYSNQRQQDEAYFDSSISTSKESQGTEAEEADIPTKFPGNLYYNFKSKSLSSERLPNEGAGDSGSVNNNFSDEEANPYMAREGLENFQYPIFSRASTANYLSWQPTIGRNSVFLGLTREQKDELGGVEYRALKLLCGLLVIYYIGFHLMVIVFLVPWIYATSRYKEVATSYSIAPAWWGFFTGMSAFNDLGYMLTPNSLMSFNAAVYPLIIMMIFIIIGNTGFPVMLRFIIWVLHKCSRDLSQLRESLEFLLDHPRRCFTLLFPSGATWWLFISLIALNGTDLVLFIILDLNLEVLEALPKGIKVLDGLFQAVSTRTAGFNVVDLSLLHPSVQVSYMLMMYVSVLPLAISIRRTNVYEEQSLGIYRDPKIVEGSKEEEEGTLDDNKKKSCKDSAGLNSRSFIGAHLRRQLSYDIWFLFLGLFIICICEGSKIRNNNNGGMNIFSILFEIVSAYGTVGLSLGYPNTTTSLSAQFSTISKLVIIAMLIRGRHRGLPYTVDRAIILPSKRLEKRDHVEDRRRSVVHVNGAESTTASMATGSDAPGDAVTDYFKRKSHKLQHMWEKARQ